jgi:hypothetical protein
MTTVLLLKYFLFHLFHVLVFRMVRLKRRPRVRYSERDPKRRKGTVDDSEDDELAGVVGNAGDVQQDDEFQDLWSTLPLELKERVLQHLPTSSVVRFACTLSTEWHWTFLGGCQKYPKGFVDTFLRPILLGSILATIQRYSRAIKSYIRP